MQTEQIRRACFAVPSTLPQQEAWIECIAQLSQQILKPALTHKWALHFHPESPLLPFFPSELTETHEADTIAFVRQETAFYQLHHRTTDEIEPLPFPDPAHQPLRHAILMEGVDHDATIATHHALLASEARTIHAHDQRWRHSPHLLGSALLIYKDLRALVHNLHWSQQFQCSPRPPWTPTREQLPPAEIDEKAWQAAAREPKLARRLRSYSLTEDDTEQWLAAIAQYARQVIPRARRAGWSIIIDTHEHFLIPFFPSSVASVQTVNPADIWFMQHGEPRYMIERKSIRDISQARRTKSYENQKIRLLNTSLAPRGVAYLIEEDGSQQPIRARDEQKGKHHIMSIDKLLGCAASTTHRDGLGWRHSIHTLYTVLLLYHDLDALCTSSPWNHPDVASQPAVVAKNALRTDLKMALAPDTIPTAASRSFHKRSQPPLPPRLQGIAPTQDDPRVVWIYMLQMVRAMSVHRAAAVQERWPTLPDFLRDMAPLATQERIKRLAQIPFRVCKPGKAPGKPQKLGPAVATRLIRIIMG